MLSANKESDDDMMCCASCGVAEMDDIKLKKCTACKSVRYCSVECQKKHRPKHKRACKKRAAELRDEILFRQPESSDFGDCPICLLPLPIDPRKSTMQSCCSKSICNGCVHAYYLREEEGQSQKQKCPFCRHPAPNSKEEINRNVMKRIELNDPVALRQEGTRRYKEGDYEGAVKCWTKAAELGDVAAHYQLSVMYNNGIGVERDEKKELHHLSEAAISGHPDARVNLAVKELRKGRYERAAKHLIIAANLGHDTSIQRLKALYEGGTVSKEDFAAALRAHQAAVDATKSPQREEVEAFLQNRCVGASLLKA